MAGPTDGPSRTLLRAKRGTVSLGFRRSSRPSPSWTANLKSHGRGFSMTSPNSSILLTTRSSSTFSLDYYWSVMESEWATDVMFRSPQALALHYRTLVHHGVTTFSSPNVMRFLGKNILPTGRIPPRFAGELVTDLKHRPEGIRIKHRLKSNAIKLYDKQGSVLRVETTINDPSDFKVYRKKESGKTTKPEWLRLRKGVANFQRLAQVSQTANERYLEALASAHDSTPLKNWTDKLCRPVMLEDKAASRALNPYSPADCRPPQSRRPRTIQHKRLQKQGSLRHPLRKQVQPEGTTPCLSRHHTPHTPPPSPWPHPKGPQVPSLPPH